MLKLGILAFIFILNKVCALDTCGTKSNSTVTFESEISAQQSRIWPNGVVRYQISSSFDATDKKIIRSALNHFTQKLKGCIIFLETETNQKRVYITNTQEMRYTATGQPTSCWATRGFAGKTKQTMNLGTEMENSGFLKKLKKFNAKHIKWLGALRGSSPAHKSWLQPKMSKAKANRKKSQPPLKAPKFMFLSVFSSRWFKMGWNSALWAGRSIATLLTPQHAYIPTKIKFGPQLDHKTEGIGPNSPFGALAAKKMAPVQAYGMDAAHPAGPAPGVP